MRNPSVLIGVFLTLGIVPAVNGQTWTNIAGGNWSNPANWPGNAVPVSGPTTQLIFPTYPPNNGSYTATNDLGLNPFVLNGLTFNSADTNSATLVVANAAGSSLQFAGVNPFVMQSGIGNASLSGTTVDLASPLTILGAGTGDLTIASQLTGSGSLIINRGSSNTAAILSNSANSFAGGITLNSGALSYGAAGAFGSGTITVATTGTGTGVSGTLVANVTSAIPNAFTINSGATLSVIALTTIGGPIGGAGGLNVGGSSSTLSQLTLSAVANYSGPTRIDGKLILTAGSTLSATSSIDIGPNGTLSLQGGATIIANAPLNMALGTLTMTNATNQTFSNISIDGQNKLDLGNQGALAIGNLNRQNRATVFIEIPSPNLQGIAINSINGISPASWLVGGGADLDSPDVSIIPFIGTDTIGVSGSGFVTYSPPLGLRPLNSASSYAPTLPLTTLNTRATNNVRLTAPVSGFSATATRNSLVIDGVNGGAWGLGGPTGSLTITSGALLAGGTSPTRLAIGTLEFGSAEGVIYDASSTTFVISSAISGSRGITVNGRLTASGTLNETRLLNPANAFTGAITINSGMLSYQDDGALGNSANLIVLNGGSLLFRGYSTTLSRPITVGPAGGSILGSGGWGQSLTISNSIIGSGNLTFSAPNSSGVAPPVTLTGDNSGFNGLMTAVGILRVDSDIRLGGPSATFTGTLNATASFSTDRNFFGDANVVVDPGATFTFNGHILSIPGLSAEHAFGSSGGGTMIVTNPQTGHNSLSVGAGTFILQDNGSVTAKFSPSVSAGGRLVLANGSTNIANRLGGGEATLAGGALRIEGNSAAPTTEAVSRLSVIDPAVGFIGYLTSSRLELAPLGSQTVTFTTGSLQLNSSSFTIAGVGLSATGQSRVQFTTPPPLVGGILPRVFGMDSGIAGLVTTDAISAGAAARLLTAAEYTPSLSGAPVTANVRLAAPETAANQTVNSLTLNNNGLTVPTGTTLTLSSGTLLALPGNAGVNGGGMVSNAGTSALTIFTAGSGSDTTVFDARFGGAFIVKSGPGTLVANRLIAVSNGLSVTEGTLRLGATGGIFTAGGGPVVVQSGATLDLNDVSTTVSKINGSGTVQLGALAGTVLTFNGGSNGIGSADNTFDGAIIGAGSIVKSGNQSITFSNPALIAAPIAIQGGTLMFAPTQFASASMAGGTVTISDGATFRVNSGGMLSRDILVNVGATTGTSTLTLASAGLTLSGAITIGTNKMLTLTAANITDGQSQITGAIGGAGRLTISSAGETLGTINLVGNNSYSGGTTITALNTVGIGSDSGFGSGTVTISAAATLGTVNGPRSLSNNLAVNSDFTFDNFHSLAFTGLTTLGGTGTVRTITVLGAGNATLSNVAGSGTVQALNKVGGGTLTLAGNNTYTGSTAISAGTLLVNGGASLAGSGAVVVGGAAGSAPGILGGSGTIAGPVTVNASGIISLSTAPTTLTLQNGLTHSFGSTYLWKLNQNTTANPGVNWDRIAVTGGSVTVNAGANFVPSFIGSATVPNSAVPFWQTQQTWDNVILAGSVNSATFTIDNSLWANAGAFSTFASGAGVSLRWTPVPEPTTLLAVCGAALLVWKRARRLKPTATEL